MAGSGTSDPRVEISSGSIPPVNPASRPLRSGLDVLRAHATFRLAERLRDGRTPAPALRASGDEIVEETGSICEATTGRMARRLEV